MHDPVLVRGIERGDDLRGDLERPRQRQRTARDELIEGLSIHEFEDEKQRAADLLDRMDRGDVGVIQRGQQLRFAAKPRQ